MSRWYDKHTILSREIDLMRDMDDQQQDHLMRGIMKIIRQRCPTLLDDFVDDFPMDIHRKRWYDQDPYVWLTINGLQYAQDDLIRAVESYLESESSQFPRQSQQSTGDQL